VNFNGLIGVENKLNLPQHLRIVSNPNDIYPPEKPKDPPKDPSTGD